MKDRDGKGANGSRITIRTGAGRGGDGVRSDAGAAGGDAPAGANGAAANGHETAANGHETAANSHAPATNGYASTADGNASASTSPAALALLTDRIDRLARDMNRAQLREYVELTHKPWRLIWRSFISGLSRGIGIALGFTFFAATIVWLLQLLGALNLPIVGDYIADIVRIVKRQLEINPY